MRALQRLAAVVVRNDRAIARAERAMLLAGAIAAASVGSLELSRRMLPPAPATCGPYDVVRR